MRLRLRDSPTVLLLEHINHLVVRYGGKRWSNGLPSGTARLARRGAAVQLWRWAAASAQSQPLARAKGFRCVVESRIQSLSGQADILYGTLARLWMSELLFAMDCLNRCHGDGARSIAERMELIGIGDDGSSDRLRCRAPHATALTRMRLADMERPVPPVTLCPASKQS